MSRERLGKARLVGALLLLVIAGLLIAACGGDDENESQDDGGEDSAGASEESGEPTEGGTVTLAGEVDADSLDPQGVTSRQAAMMMTHFYDTLVIMDHGLEEPHGLLAEDWEISEDGTEYTFTLKEGVTFHSGKELDANDVVETFERWRDEDTASPTEVALGQVDTIEALDDLTVRLTLEQPDNFLLFNLSMPWASILNAEELDDDYGTTEADGTGPFEIVEWNPGDTMRMERHEDYTWGADIFENTGPAHVDELVWRVIPEGGTRVAALQSGEVDMLAEGGQLLEFVPILEEDDTLVTEKWDLLNVGFLAFKIAKPEMEQVEVRRALNHAVNKEALIEGTRAGLAIPANCWIHPDMPYSWDGCQQEPYDYDPDEAIALLEEAGWEAGDDGIREKDGMRLSLDVYAGQASEEQLTLAQSDFEAVGAELNLNLVDRTSLYDIRQTEEPDLNSIWLPYDTADVLRTYFHCDQQPSPNRFNFCEEEVDELLERGLSAADDAEAEEAYHEVQRIIHEEALTIPLEHRQEFSSYSENIGGVRIHPMYGIGIFKSMDMHRLD